MFKFQDEEINDDNARTPQSQTRPEIHIKKRFNWSLALTILLLAIIVFNFFQLVHYLKSSISLFRPSFQAPSLPNYNDLNDLKSLCENTFWKKNLYLNCTNISGGLVNVRNSVVSCLRWAIDAGAGLVLPLIGSRAKDNPSEFFVTWENLDYLFDLPNMLNKLEQACPQLVIEETFLKVEYQLTPVPTKWFQYFSGEYLKRVEDQLILEQYSKINFPTAFIEDNPLFGWNLFKEKPRIHEELFEIVQFNHDYREIAGLVLRNMPSVFIGLHLRAEKDVGPGNYERIVPWFKEEILSKFRHVKDIYIATGDLILEDRFRREMEILNFHVHSKGTSAEQDKTLATKLKDLYFDQLAIIDYEVLLKSYHFFGVARSSFSWALAYERGNTTLSNCDCNLMGIADPLFVCCY